MTTIRELQERCGKAAEAKGFHEDRPRPFMDVSGDITYPGLADWQGNKLMLVVSEVAEAQDELRKGHPADHTYYVDSDEGTTFTAAEHKHHPSLWANRRNRKAPRLNWRTS